MKPRTKLQEQVMKILRDVSYWQPPSSRTIAKILGKKGHMGVEIAIKNLIKRGDIQLVEPKYPQPSIGEEIKN